MLLLVFIVIVIAFISHPKIKQDVRSVNHLKPVELRKFMNAIESYSPSNAPDNTPTSPEPAKSPVVAAKPKKSVRLSDGSMNNASGGAEKKAKAKFSWVVSYFLT